MKTLLIFISIVLAGTITVLGQNYIGINQSRIIKTIGEPDKIGDNYIVYNNVDEEGGSNIYYFDEDNNCISFILTRTNLYYDDYQKMLKKEFTETDGNKYLKKLKKYNCMAEITKSQNEFQIRIHHLAIASVKEIL